MNKVYQITEAGKNELKDELETLKGRRGEIAEKIAEARDYGDLSEYDAAREEQGIVETRIAEIENILQNAAIITGGVSGQVGLGSVVELMTGSKTAVYTVVGPVEADPLEGKVSNESPIGAALMGKKVDDIVEINTPKGKLEYKIISIK